MCGAFNNQPVVYQNNLNRPHTHRFLQFICLISLSNYVFFLKFKLISLVVRVLSFYMTPNKCNSGVLETLNCPYI